MILKVCLPSMLVSSHVSLLSLLSVQQWMSHHKLKINCSKTEYLVISSRHDARAYDLQRPITIGGESISSSTTPGFVNWVDRGHSTKPTQCGLL